MQFVLNGRTYEVLGFLGKGKGGYSYLVTDGVGRFTLKRIHHEPCDYYTFGDKLGSELRDFSWECSFRMAQALRIVYDLERKKSI